MGRIRKTTSLTLLPVLVLKAKKLGLNISKICENALKEVIKRLTVPDCPENPGNMTSADPEKIFISGMKVLPCCSGGVVRLSMRR